LYLASQPNDKLRCGVAFKKQGYYQTRVRPNSYIEKIVEAKNFKDIVNFYKRVQR
jgi:hypothetical protein